MVRAWTGNSYRFAKAITTYVMDFGLPEVEVVFTVFTESAYYINGSIVQVRAIRKIFIPIIKYVSLKTRAGIPAPFLS